MAGPTLSVGLNPEFLLQIGDAQKAAAAAGEEIKRLEKKALAFERVGKQLDKADQMRLKRLEMVKDAADKSITRERTLLEQQKRTKIEIGRTKEALEGVKAVLGGEVARKLIKGEKLDFGDVARFAIASERAGVKLAEKVFGQTKITSAIKGAFRAAPVVGEAVASLSDAFERVGRERDEARGMGRRAGSGQITQAELEYFQSMNESFWRSGKINTFRNPKQEFDAARKALSSVDVLESDKVQEALDRAFSKSVNRDVSVGFGMLTIGRATTQHGTKMPTAQEMKAKIEEAVRAAEKEAGHALNAAERETTIGAAIGVITGMTTAQKDALIKELANLMEADKEGKSGRIKPAHQLFREEHEEKHRKWLTSKFRSYSPDIRNDFDPYPVRNDNEPVGATGPERDPFHNKMQESLEIRFQEIAKARFWMARSGHARD